MRNDSPILIVETKSQLELTTTTSVEFESDISNTTNVSSKQSSQCNFIVTISTILLTLWVMIAVLFLINTTTFLYLWIFHYFVVTFGMVHIIWYFSCQTNDNDKIESNTIHINNVQTQLQFQNKPQNIANGSNINSKPSEELVLRLNLIFIVLFCVFMYLWAVFSYISWINSDEVDKYALIVFILIEIMNCIRSYYIFISIRNILLPKLFISLVYIRELNEMVIEAIATKNNNINDDQSCDTESVEFYNHFYDVYYHHYTIHCRNMKIVSTGVIMLLMYFVEYLWDLVSMFNLNERLWFYVTFFLFGLIIIGSVMYFMCEITLCYDKMNKRLNDLIVKNKLNHFHKNLLSLRLLMEKKPINAHVVVNCCHCGNARYVVTYRQIIKWIIFVTIARAVAYAIQDTI